MRARSKQPLLFLLCFVASLPQNLRECRGHVQRAKPVIKAFLYPIVFLAMATGATGIANEFADDLVAAAIERTHHDVEYDGAYYPIAYPNGDVPSDIGVCTDVIIRSYRALGVDLQELVHEDMSQNFAAYPSRRIWGLTAPDTNIDHRRVPNLQTFLVRHGEVLAVSSQPGDYQPGDLVTWMLPGNLPHIGIVTDQISPRSGNPLIAHNIGRGPELQDMLYDFEITGHYRFLPDAHDR